jgi:hypothetical protein
MSLDPTTDAAAMGRPRPPRPSCAVEVAVRPMTYLAPDLGLWRRYWISAETVNIVNPP